MCRFKTCRVVRRIQPFLNSFPCNFGNVQNIGTGLMRYLIYYHEMRNDL